MAKRIYQLAKELNCSEKELMDFLNNSGVLCSNRFALVSDKGYEIAKEHFSKSKLCKELIQITKNALEQKKLTVKFDYKPILVKFNLSDMKKSPIKYFEAVLSVADELLDILRDYETAHADKISECLSIAHNLKAKYVDNPNLTAEENLLLAERQKFLAERLELRIDEPKRRILLAKEEAENFFARLDKINGEENPIRAFTELQAEPRADFELLTENLARIVLTAQRKVDFFVEYKDFIFDIVKANGEWSDDYKSFKTSLREELSADCRNDDIDDEIFAAWHKDWQKKRFAIEKRFLPLVEFGFKGDFSEVVSSVLKILQYYRDAVDKFYLNERKKIYHKFAFMIGGELQEKFETESELYKLQSKFQHDLQGIIFSREKSEERIFLLRWSEPLLKLPIDEITDFIREKELDAISQETLTKVRLKPHDWKTKRKSSSRKWNRNIKPNLPQWNGNAQKSGAPHNLKSFKRKHWRKWRLKRRVLRA